MEEIFKLDERTARQTGIIASKSGFVALTGSKVGKKQVYIKDDQAFVRPRAPKRLEFGPTTATTVTFGGSQQITEYRIYEQPDFEQANNIVIRGKITKVTDAAFASLLVPSPLWIERIELLTNGTTQPIHTLYGDQLWYSLSLMPTEQLKTLLGGNLLYMGTNFKVDNSIPTTSATTRKWSTTSAAAVSRQFVIPIVGSVLEKLRLRALSGDTIMRVYWASNIAANASGTGLEPTLDQNYDATASAKFSLSETQLIIESDEVLYRDKVSFDRLYANNALFVKYLEPTVQSFSQTLTTNVETAYQLTAIQGPIVFLQVYIRRSDKGASLTYALAAEQQTIGLAASTAQDDSSADYGSINITDASNKPLHSPNGFRPYDLRYHHYSQFAPNEWPNSIPWYQINFCENPVAAVHKGSVDGYAMFDGSEYVRIRPNGDFSAVSGNANVRVFVVAWKMKHLKLEKFNGKGLAHVI